LDRQKFFSGVPFSTTTEKVFWRGVSCTTEKKFWRGESCTTEKICWRGVYCTTEKFAGVPFTSTTETFSEVAQRTTPEFFSDVANHHDRKIGFFFFPRCSFLLLRHSSPSQFFILSLNFHF
jgi:hypothetical protein